MPVLAMIERESKRESRRGTEELLMLSLA